MKFMEKAKRFFTLSAKHEGFTLVELIVVIAILAILAGVAIPAYSGYIKKAQEAGDQTLLAAVNKAFAAACMENGVDAVTQPDGAFTITLDAERKVSAVSHYDEEFAFYYAGNEQSAFKVFENLVFVGGVFQDSAQAGKVSVSYAGSNILVSLGAMQALKDSTFGQNMSSDALLNQIGTVTNAAAIMADSLDAVWADPAYKAAAMAALGATTEAEYNAKTGALVEQLIAQGKTPEEAMNQLQANAAVLYASQHAVNYSQEQIDALFTKGNADAVKNNLKGAGTADGMAQAALVYGMYTAYANSNEYGNDDLREKAENPLTVLNALNNDDNFLAYVNSEQGKTDMAALQSSLGVVVDSTKNNESATTDLMLNGFNNDELKNVIGGLMG